jgi:hypothetical protein
MQNASKNKIGWKRQGSGPDAPWRKVESNDSGQSSPPKTSSQCSGARVETHWCASEGRTKKASDGRLLKDAPEIVLGII